ncbi:hypothetical protein BDZ94DRAFT_1180278, partial [Collybia nuda]
MGGGKCPTYFIYDNIKEYQVYGTQNNIALTSKTRLKYLDHIQVSEVENTLQENPASIVCDIPISILYTRLTKKQLQKVTCRHQIKSRSNATRNEIECELNKHTCSKGDCAELLTAFVPFHTIVLPVEHEPDHVGFPPKPPSHKLENQIISDFCNDTSPKAFMESGCMVCGEL